MDNFAVVWIETNGTFRIKGFQLERDAEHTARITNESGYPCVVITRQEVIEGDLKSNSQLEEEEDER